MDGAALAHAEPIGVDGWGGAPVAPVADPMATIRLVYAKPAIGRTYVQVVAVAVKDVERRLYDLVLVAWGKSRNPMELEFLLALDEVGGFLGNAEGLMLYCAHNMDGAREDIYLALNDNGKDP